MRALRFVLIALILIVLGVAPASRTIAATTPSLATLMPADVFIFAEFRTDDLTNRLAAIETFLGKANISSNIVSSFDRALTQAFGRPASLAKDVVPWLGDRIAMGMFVPDSMFDAVFTRRSLSSGSPAETLFLATVNDEAAADAFLKEVIASLGKSGPTVTTKSDTVAGNPATLYVDGSGGPIMMRWKGYLAVGGPPVAHLLDTMNNKKATLDADPSYRTVAGMLKPDNAATIYVRAPFSPPGYVVFLALMGPAIGNIFENIVRDLRMTPGPNPTATPTPTPTPTPAPALFELASTFRNLGVSAMGFYGDAKTASVDFAFHVNPDNLQKTFTLLKVPATVQLAAPAKSISLQMADRISNKAIFVAIGSDLAQLTRNGLVLAQVVQKLLVVVGGVPSSSSVEASYAQAQATLKQLFELDLDKDVFSWMGGDFALYSMRAPASTAPAPGALPFDQVLLVDATDSAKAQSFLDKLNTGIGKLGGASPTQGSSGLFTFQMSPSAPGIGYGLIKNTFVLGTSGGSADAASAVRGDGTLTSSPDWKEATAALPKAYQHVWYVNMAQLGAWLQELATQSRSSSDQQTATLVGQFKSAILYSTDLGGGSSLTTLTLFMK
jgi:hypothetical protein